MGERCARREYGFRPSGFLYSTSHLTNYFTIYIGKIRRPLLIDEHIVRRPFRFTFVILCYILCVTIRASPL